MLFKPHIEKLPEIHNKLGPDYEERVLPSVANEVMKATIAQYNAEQLLTQREHVSAEIREAIVQRAAGFNILMDDVSITHLTYGKEFARAIEEKQVAEQEAERQKFVVARSEQERQATVIKAEGEAEGTKPGAVAKEGDNAGSGEEVGGEDVDLDSVDDDGAASLPTKRIVYFIGYSILIAGLAIVWALDMVFDDVKNR